MISATPVGDRTILDGISIEASSGRVLAVRGPSGSGKSPLLTMLGGLVAPSGGTVTLDGACVTPSSDVAVVTLAPVTDHLVEDLSGRQQQRVAIARALVTTADGFLADEQTAELDADNRELVVTLLIERARTGAAVVIASHDPDVVDACDDVLNL